MSRQDERAPLLPYHRHTSRVGGATAWAALGWAASPTSNCGLDGRPDKSPPDRDPTLSRLTRGGAYRGVNPGGTPGLPKTPSLGTRGSLYHCNPRVQGVFSANVPPGTI
jgi:hypothetical protein